jgi:alpha-L-arabinofuranosidase
MISRTWKNTVIQATSSDEKTLDITAKLSDDRREMTIYVANMTDKPRQALINIEGFNFKSRSEVQTIGDCDLNESNTYNNKENVVFKRSEAVIAKKNSRYTFPRYSFTVITLK